MLRWAGAPLRLTAAKSRVGHSEPVAGTVGLSHAAAMLAHSSTSAVMHLRSFNPMLIGLIQAHTAAGHAAPYIARQDGTGLLGAAAGAAGQAVSGVSAFAFQGTNAHAVLVRGSGLPTGQTQLDGQWQRQRSWFAPRPHALVTRMAAARPAAQFQAHIQGAALSYLWDHIVQHRPLFPGAAMFEAAYAAGAQMLGGSTANGPLALANVSIPAPLVLSGLDGSSPASSALLTTVVEPASGRVVLRSSTAAGMGVAHLAGAFARSLATAAAVHSQRWATVARQHAALPWLVGSGAFMAADSQTQPGATATVQQSPRSQEGQYHVHPAVIDNATQVGTVTAACQPVCCLLSPGPACITSEASLLPPLLQVGSALSRGNASASTRVPAGLGAFVAAVDASGSLRASWTASAAVVGGASDGAVALSYGLAAAEASTACLQIGEMLFKPVGGRPHAAPAAAASAAAREQEEAAQLIYVVSWEASHSTAPLVQQQPLSAMRHSLRWDLDNGSHVRLHAGSGAAAFDALQTSLKLLQSVTATRARPTVSLSTQLLMPGMRRSSPAHAAVAGLVKVAARESSGQHFAHFTHHAFAAQAERLPPQLSDMFGVGVAGKWGTGGGAACMLCCRIGMWSIELRITLPNCVLLCLPAAGGALYTPRMVAVPQEAALAPLPPNRDVRLSMHGSMLITGGLGDIGQLAGHWVAATAARSHVWLLGRSGRSARSMAAALSGHRGCVSTAAADAASRADMAGLLGLVASSNAPAVTGILHAGAVLQDALLSRQTAASLRAVFAPKVPGALCLLGANSAMPLQGLVQFSSLTAQLGTPGQSNYAAANGALDGLAQDWLNRGLRSSSVLWGPWASGLALSDPRILARFQKAGLCIISGEHWARSMRAVHLVLCG